MQSGMNMRATQIDVISAGTVQGSRDLLRAILETGKLYRTMTVEEIRLATISAYGGKKDLIG